MGMTSAFSGTICTPMTMTMKAVRPRNPNRATATAARNETTMEMATTESTTVRLLTTSFQKNGTCIAEMKLSNVAGAGNQ